MSQLVGTRTSKHVFESSLQALNTTRAMARSIREKRAEIYDEIDRLQQEIKIVESDSRDLESEIKIVAINFSKAWCRKFSVKIFRAFPPEIRDLVYKYLLNLDEPGEKVFVDAFHDIDTDGQENICINPYMFNLHGLPYKFDISSDKRYTTFCLSRQFMGTSFAKEISEKFYKSNIFVLDYPPYLRSFLTTDHIDGGSKASDHLRRLDICLDLPYSPSGWASTSNPTLLDKEEYAPKGTYVDMAKELEKDIVEVKKHRGFELNVFLECKLEATLKKFQEVLVPVVYRLKHLGFKVSMHYELIDVNEIRHFGECDFSIPQEEWDAQIRDANAFGDE